MNPRTELLLQRARVAGASQAGLEALAAVTDVNASVVYLTTAEGEFSMIFAEADKAQAFAQELANEGRNVELATPEVAGVNIVLPTNSQAERDAFILAERQAAASQGDMTTAEVKTTTAPDDHPLAGDGDTPELIIQPRTSDTADVAEAIRVSNTGFAPGESVDDVRARHGLPPRDDGKADHTPAQLLTAFAFAHGAIAVHAPPPFGEIDPAAPEGRLRVTFALEPSSENDGGPDYMAADFLDVPCAVKFIRALADRDDVAFNSAMLACGREHEAAVTAAMEEAYGRKVEKPDDAAQAGLDKLISKVAEAVAEGVTAYLRQRRKARLLRAVDGGLTIALFACILPFARFAPSPAWVDAIALAVIAGIGFREFQKGHPRWAMAAIFGCLVLAFVIGAKVTA